MVGTQFCASIRCTNSRKKKPDLSFFRFPKDKERSRRWVQHSRREDLLGRTSESLYRSCVFCAEHFEDSQFMNSDKKKLVWDAVPTKFDVPNLPPQVTSKRPPRTSRDPIPNKKSKLLASPTDKGSQIVELMQSEHLPAPENNRRMVTMDTMVREVRELYLSKFQPQHRHHALSPKVFLHRLSPTLLEKCTTRSGRTNDDSLSDEREAWLDDDRVDGVVSDDDHCWIQDPLPSPLTKDDNNSSSSSELVKKRKSANTAVKRSRRKRALSEVVEVDIKQEEEVVVVEDTSSAAVTTVPMTILPADTYPHLALYTNTLISQPSVDPLEVVKTAREEATIKEETSEGEVIVMPFIVRENSKPVIPSSAVLVTDQSLSKSEGTSNKTVSPATNEKSLKDLSEYLLELNENTLKCTKRIEKIRQEYERRVSTVEAEKMENEREIGRVLLLIKSLKDPEDDQSSPHSTPPVSPEITTAESSEKQRHQSASSKNNFASSSSASSTGKAGKTGARTSKSKKTTTRPYDKKPLVVKYWAVRALETGQSKTQVMAKYGVPPSTLSDWFRQKYSIKQAYENSI
ncbi:hypothetical protein Pcinc_015989 [Petrolisthes cinctipes]|uniref:THAP-type domain-containing protein n=1 Tax=Petrolisthes cinctipes TaxID=88211 RepID=A0AAE1FUJ6_PETCI|nr:hypothetical protein Pcinc_015989 [Petrolisthes cinctipes]